MSYGPSRGCDALLNAWCDANCVHSAEHGPLLARIDASAASAQIAWRCYARSTLSADGLRYESGETYCTRHPQLLELLERCERGGSVATAADPARSLCRDDVPECAAWAAYDQCEKNEMWMRRHCAKSCGTCRAPPRLPLPSPMQTPPSATPAWQPDAVAADSTEDRGPPPHHRPSSVHTGESAEAKCRSACGGERGGPPRAPDRCLGRGRCVPHRGFEWCECDISPTARAVGLQCERAIGVGEPCARGCGEHGTCVHGYCDCEFGWHGVDCGTRGLPSPFLTQRMLLDAGLSVIQTSDGANGMCFEPNIHQAFARPVDDLQKLMRSIPDVSPKINCATCAVVSNAGSLLDREYGEHIDSNECVFRINRGPTDGFERHVGSRTTFDYLNSFPHVRGLEILPRTDSHIIHGMAVELWANPGRPSGRVGFDEYMAWVDGHVQVHERYPQLRTDVVDLDWMQNSWEAYFAALAPFESPVRSRARPSSGWHVARLALGVCGKVRMYGFSMASNKFHYFDSYVQETVTPEMRDPRHGTTHKFAFEHEVFINWSRAIPKRFELWQ